MDLPHFIINVLISIALVITTTVIYYEILRLCWNHLPKAKGNPRKRIIAVIFAIFAGHTAAVWMYGTVYYLIAHFIGSGSLAGSTSGSFLEYIYYSAVVYSTLGLGDVYPTGSLRFFSGIEALNGLVLIGWSVSFTYLAMHKFWDMHKSK